MSKKDLEANKNQSTVKPQSVAQPEKVSDDLTKDASGGFSYNYNLYSTNSNGYQSRSENSYYNLTEAEREKLRKAGCKFSISESSGEIDGVINRSGSELTAKQISDILLK